MNQLEGKRIFIVEDNLTNRAIMQLLIEQQNGKVAFERWGVDTLKRLKAFAPVHLVLLDLMFPGGVTGFDVFDQIRTDLNFQSVPIVAVSAMDASVAIPQVRDRGFQGFIAKPIEYDTFIPQVLKLLNGENVWYTG